MIIYNIIYAGIQFLQCVLARQMVKQD